MRGRILKLLQMSMLI